MKEINYTLAEIAEIIGASNQTCSDKTKKISHISLDSRQLYSVVDSLFFAIEGKQHDGHNYIPQLLEKGLMNFVVSRNIEIPQSQSATLNILKVDDSTEALQKLAAFHRKQFQFPVIGITGSNGKTIVKEWLFQLLAKRFNIVRSPKSYNSQIGVPLSVWQMKPMHELGIFEAGISQPNEMGKLEKILKPEIGILTNIGYAHSEGFKSSEEKLKEKLKLFHHSKVLIFPADDKLIQNGIEELIQERVNNGEEKLQLFGWGNGENAQVKITDLKTEHAKTYIQLQYENNKYAVNLPFGDKASIENAISCACLGICLGITDLEFFSAFEQLTNVAMRLELKEAVNQCSLINDSYNSDLGSLKIALDFLKQQKQHTSKTIILSDILQSGMSEKMLYSDVSGMLEDSDIHNFIAIGPALCRNQEMFKSLRGSQFFYKDTDDFLEAIPSHHFNNETILLKGARDFHFEKIDRLLARKFHETVFEINLNAVAHNLAVVRQHLGNKSKIMAMVKAFSYGSGSFEIANMLQFQHVDYLAVAYVDEGVALRNAGINLPILVLNPDENSFESLLHYKLEPEIYSFRLLNSFIKKYNDNGCNSEFRIHIKLDTGMHRLGFLPDEIEEVASIIKGQSNLEIASILSHLSSSEDPNDDTFTKHQINIFKTSAEKLEHAIGYKTIKHILNSSGTVRFPEAKFDMVRVGLVLYGIDVTGVLSDKLEPVGQLKTTISQIKSLQKGDSVGYNRAYTAQKSMRIATIAIGYADGYRRIFGNKRASVLIAGKKATLIGNVCMDMSMVDITDIPEAREGDEVIVFGKGLPVEQLAKWAETIPYEILTGIGERVKRIYFKE